MAKQIIKLTESDLHRIIKESVNRIIKESRFNLDGMSEDDLIQRLAGLNDQLKIFKKKKVRGKEFLEVAQEAQAIKEKLGLSKIQKLEMGKVSDQQHGKATSRHKNGHPWKIDQKKAHEGLRDINKDDNEKLQVNDVDSILGS